MVASMDGEKRIIDRCDLWCPECEAIVGITYTIDSYDRSPAPLVHHQHAVQVHRGRGYPPITMSVTDEVAPMGQHFTEADEMVLKLLHSIGILP